MFHRTFILGVTQALREEFSHVRPNKAQNIMLANVHYPNCLGLLVIWSDTWSAHVTREDLACSAKAEGSHQKDVGAL